MSTAAERLSTVAERLNPAAERLPAGAACFRCRYDLGGLAADGVCPECGLMIAASWPRWDLRRCHRMYVQHVAEEFRMLSWVAQGVCVVLLATLLACVVGMSSSDATGLAVVAIIAALLGFGAALVLPLLVGFALRVLRRHANAAHAPGAACRRRIRRALRVALLGLLGVVACMVGGLFTGQDALAALLLACTGVTTVALACASFEVAGYARLTLRRAGRASAWHGLLAAWIIALVAFAATAIGSRALGVDGPEYVAAIVAPQLVPATMIALRTDRVVAVLKGMAADRV